MAWSSMLCHGMLVHVPVLRRAALHLIQRLIHCVFCFVSFSALSLYFIQPSALCTLCSLCNDNALVVSPGCRHKDPKGRTCTVWCDRLLPCVTSFERRPCGLELHCMVRSTAKVRSTVQGAMKMFLHALKTTFLWSLYVAKQIMS